jgi:hypothetical protein
MGDERRRGKSERFLIESLTDIYMSPSSQAHLHLHEYMKRRIFSNDDDVKDSRIRRRPPTTDLRPTPKRNKKKRMKQPPLHTQHTQMIAVEKTTTSSSLFLFTFILKLFV